MAALDILTYPDERLKQNSRAVQHELDHLDGLLFLDRLVSARELFRRKTYLQG